MQLRYRRGCGRLGERVASLPRTRTSHQTYIILVLIYCRTAEANHHTRRQCRCARPTVPASYGHLDDNNQSRYDETYPCAGPLPRRIVCQAVESGANSALNSAVDNPPHSRLCVFHHLARFPRRLNLNPLHCAAKLKLLCLQYRTFSGSRHLCIVMMWSTTFSSRLNGKNLICS